MRRSSELLAFVSAETGWDPGPLSSLLKTYYGQRILLLGLGNTLKADDGVGPHICERIKDKISAEVLDVGTVPENYLGPITRYDADVVLLIDAADLGQQLGSIGIYHHTVLRSGSLSTHTPSISLLLNAMRQGKKMPVLLLGIQPACLELGESMSPDVQEAAETLISVLQEVFG